MKPANFAKSAIYAAIFALTSGVILPSVAADNLASLEVRQSGAVPFVSGGVGDEERQQIEKLSPAYPLQLLFATKGWAKVFTVARGTGGRGICIRWC